VIAPQTWAIAALGNTGGVTQNSCVFQGWNAKSYGIGGLSLDFYWSSTVDRINSLGLAVKTPGPA
jgi:hypothetical protein